MTLRSIKILVGVGLLLLAAIIAYEVLSSPPEAKSIATRAASETSSKLSINAAARRASEAISDIEKGNDTLALALLREEYDVRPSDARFSEKRRVTLALAKRYVANDRALEASRLLDDIRDEDDDDIVVFAAWADAAIRSPQTEADAVRDIARMFERSPQDMALAELYGNAALDRTDPGAVRAFLKRIRVDEAGGAPVDGWQIFWRGEGPFSSDHRRDVVPDIRDGRLSLQSTLPHPLAEIRIDAPPGSRLRLSNVEAKIAEQTFPVRPEDVVQRMHIKNDAGALVTTGEIDPYFTFANPLKDVLGATGESIILVSFTAEQIHPAWIQALIDSL